MRAPAHQARPDQHTNVQRTAECSGSSAGCLIVRKAPRGGLSMPSQASDRENRFPGGSIRAATWRAQKNLADPFSPPSLLGPRSWLLAGRLWPQTPDRPPPTSRRGGQRPRAVHRNSWPRSSTDRRGAFAAARSHSSASRVGSRFVGSGFKSELARLKSVVLCKSPLILCFIEG